jgi:hypothetical protein
MSLSVKLSAASGRAAVDTCLPPPQAMCYSSSAFAVPLVVVEGEHLLVSVAAVAAAFGQEAASWRQTILVVVASRAILRVSCSKEERHVSGTVREKPS